MLRIVVFLNVNSGSLKGCLSYFYKKVHSLFNFSNKVNYKSILSAKCVLDTALCALRTISVSVFLTQNRPFIFKRYPFSQKMQVWEAYACNRVNREKTHCRSRISVESMLAPSVCCPHIDMEVNLNFLMSLLKCN